MSLSAVTAAILLSVTPIAAPDDRQRVDGDLIEALAACLDIKEPTQRLACTDTAARRLVDASRRREVVLVDKEQVQKTRRSLFGFSLPKIDLFGRGGTPDPREEIDQYEAKITRVAALPYGKYAITIEGDARWTTTEAWTRDPLPTVGATLTIKKAALGGYFVKVGSSRAVRAMRVG